MPKPYYLPSPFWASEGYEAQDDPAISEHKHMLVSKQSLIIKVILTPTVLNYV